MLYEVHTLIEGGFPFGGDAFDLSFWMDLGVLRQRLKRCPL
jgi:hypothetical protein